MKCFPKELENDDKLSDLYIRFYKERIRAEIFMFIIQQKEDDFFDIDNWIKKTNFDVNKHDITEILIPILIELKDLNWSHTFCYGNTGLFIHRHDKVLKNYYGNETLS